MGQFVFDISTKNGIQVVRIRKSGSIFSVILGGKDLGKIFRDEEIGMEWNTFDDELIKYIPEIGNVLSEILSIRNFPKVLMLAFSDIIKAEWNTSGQLEAMLTSETDLGYFLHCLDISVYSTVSFLGNVELRIGKDRLCEPVLYQINQNQIENPINKKPIKSLIMKNPEEEQNIDDRTLSEAEDQESQKDIHSNGYDQVPERTPEADSDILNQSYRAAESSYTLDIDE